MKKMNKYEFGIKLISSFVDYDNIYLIATLFEGKTLDHFKDEFMDEKKLKFISACLIQSFIYFRIENIIHRDIRFENIIMDEDKYFNVIDFSCSINYNMKNNSCYYLKNDLNIISPEILTRKEYYFNADYYGLGSIIYYLIFKTYPNIIKKEQNLTNVSIDYKNNNNYSYNCIDFINKLIETDPRKRFGYKSINEIKNHPWFNGFNWYKFEKKQIPSPFNFVKGSFNNSVYYKYKKINRMITKFKSNHKTTLYNKLIKKYEYIDISIISKLNIK